ncbi:unnamed protein product [Arabis nemorensis]|uniref:Uncharacterized protein n=1 Tax=Arabis nemorensis TaxID=586526 RepID=A0A565BSY8_9BRAS|nr:unnamed protein product [Arabis nemorensis]
MTNQNPPNKYGLEDYSRRYDRHGNPFGKRISSKNQERGKAPKGRPTDRYINLYGERISSKNLHRGRTHYNKSIDSQRTDYQHFIQNMRDERTSYSQRWSRDESLRDSRGDREERRYQQQREKPSGYRSPHLQWKEKALAIDSRKVATPESTQSRRPPLERNLDKESFSHLLVVPTTEEVMEELR